MEKEKHSGKVFHGDWAQSMLWTKQQQYCLSGKSVEELCNLWLVATVVVEINFKAWGQINKKRRSKQDAVCD
jgi:hypothetical protein